ncbi:YdcF family protein [Bacillus suaedaesalsae]|uniref:YdcF family protein n=1 Tax=Bacillus suaedaesalsae TaxID=2810349 RepID=A0ABS2DD22_9BACI|nr:YdcF family protein [Bacillus suaedaesalsae]MBM6616334.1 YdcF family protein [Bacillus suaedaesalsae]
MIAKEPNTPNFSDDQIRELTDIVFLEEKLPSPCDVIFVFGGTHSGHWEKAIEAYFNGLGNKLIVTGGFNPKVKLYESREIVKYLVEAGIPKRDIVFEDKSSNTLENVLFAKEVFNFGAINTVLFICKSYAAGSQYRTLVQHLPGHLEFVNFSFDAKFNGTTVARDNWFNSETGRKRVWGQYLRIIEYGKKGDILPLKKQIEGL